MATRLALLALGPALALGFGRFAYALVLPLMQSAWGLSYTQAEILGSANTLGYLAGAFLSHRLLGRMGYRKGFLLAVLLQDPILAFTVIGSLPLAFGLRFLQGLLGALVFVGGAALLMALGRSGRVLGTYYGGVGLGLLLAPWLLWGVTEPTGAWARLGLFSLLLGLPILLIRPLGLFLGSLPPLALHLPALSARLFGLSFLEVITALTQAFRALLPPSAWPRAMGLSTAAFALGQAVEPAVAGFFAEMAGRGEERFGPPSPFSSWRFCP